MYRSRGGRLSGGRPFSRGHLYHLLHNRVYRGEIVHRQDVYPGNHAAIIDDDLWQQTQALFNANHQAWHRDAQVRTPFLLKGLLFDAQGNRFSPLQGRKGPRAYRYYVNQVVLQFREEQPRQIRRMPAAALEQGVINAVMQALKGEDETRAWVNQVNKLEELEQHARWRHLLMRVEVSANRLRITFHPPRAVDQDAIKPKQDVDGERKQAQVRILDVSWVMTRRGGRTELQFKGAPAQAQSAPHEGFVLATVRALQWKDELVAGRVPTIKALAKREGLARSYVMRVLRLSFLAPDVIDAILNGWQPRGFTLEPFRRPIPLEWAAQRKVFGFPPL